MKFFSDEKGQASSEYLLLVALGLVIILVAVSIALKTKDLAELVSLKAENQRNETLSQITR